MRECSRTHMAPDHNKKNHYRNSNVRIGFRCHTQPSFSSCGANYAQSASVLCDCESHGIRQFLLRFLLFLSLHRGCCELENSVSLSKTCNTIACGPYVFAVANCIEFQAILARILIFHPKMFMRSLQCSTQLVCDGIALYSLPLHISLSFDFD